MLWLAHYSYGSCEQLLPGLELSVCQSVCGAMAALVACWLWWPKSEAAQAAAVAGALMIGTASFAALALIWLQFILKCCNK